MLKKHWFINAGFFTPVIFWTTTLICGMLLPNYNHATRLVSELGKLGTSTQYLFTAGLIICSLLSVAFIVGLYATAKANKLSVIPILFLTTYSFSIFGAALFPFPLKLHEILGMPAILLFLSPLTSLFLWRKIDIPNIKLWSLLILLLMLLGFLVYVPQVMDNLFGIKQRFFHVGWTFWFIYLSKTFRTIYLKQV